MKVRNPLFITLLAASFLGCDPGKKSSEKLFSIDQTLLKSQYAQGETAEIGVTNHKNTSIDSIVVFNHDSRLGKTIATKNFTHTFNNEKLGYQNIRVVVYHKDQSTTLSERIELLAKDEPRLFNYTVVNVFPHDTKAYTQGLEFHRDTLFEGTGRNGFSSLRKTNFKTGEIYQIEKLDNKYFGEGITILNNKVYQLTWQNKVGFIYDADNLKRLSEFKYPKPVEGWGLCNDGTHLYKSDGTEKIWIIDPKDMIDIASINVYTNKSKIKAVNELEWVNGQIYANIYQKDAIAIVNPKTGAVTGLLNLIGLKAQIATPNLDPYNDVLNGIAYHPTRKTLFVTGKNWDKIFEIKIEE
jgi:glutaminyl-peptide cyclotransferase